MKRVQIRELAIDDSGQLLIRPDPGDGEGRFPLIYRSASGVHWDAATQSLYCPKPRDWTYVQWFKQAMDAVADEYGCELVLSGSTEWSNVPADIRARIEEIVGDLAT
jgi:hypothetical protein